MSVPEVHYRVEGEERPLSIVWQEKVWSTAAGAYVTQTKSLVGSGGLLCRVEKDGNPAVTATGAANFITNGSDGQIQCADPTVLAILDAENSQQPGRWRVMFELDHPTEGLIRTPSRWDRPFIVEVSPLVA